MLSRDTRILLVDDVPDMRSILKKILNSLGFQNIYWAESGEYAWQLLTEQARLGEPIQLMLTDWNMMGMTGVELLKRLRTTPPFANLPVVMVTAEGEPSQVLAAMRNGVSDYIVKPFEKEDLRDKMQSAWIKHKNSFRIT